MIINYKEVLNDPTIINMYNEIDIINKGRMNHGCMHMKNVLEYIKKLAEALDLSDSEKNKIYIAAILHDVGQVAGRENHGERASIFAREYLNSKLPENQIEEIAEAIKFHSEKENLELYSFDTILLSLADKMDVSKQRITKAYLNKDILYKHINSIDFRIDKEKFEVVFDTDKSVGKQDFLNEEKNYKKFINIISEFAKRINKKLKIFFDEEIIFEKGFQKDEGKSEKIM